MATSSGVSSTQLASIAAALADYCPSDAAEAINFNAIITQIQAQANAAFVTSATPPATIRKKLGSPDKFSGNAKEDVDAWLQHMELYLNLSQIANAE